MHDVAKSATRPWKVKNRAQSEKRFEKRTGLFEVASKLHNFFGASWICLTIILGEVFWDIIWSDEASCLERNRLMVAWSNEEVDVPSGVGGTVQPIGVAHVPVELAGGSGVVRSIVVEQDIPPLMPVGLMRMLQARLNLDRDWDRVLFNRFTNRHAKTDDMASAPNGEILSRCDVVDTTHVKNLVLQLTRQSCDVAESPGSVNLREVDRGAQEPCYDLNNFKEEDGTIRL